MNANVPKKGIESPDLPRADRLSALIAALRPMATVGALDDPGATLVLTPRALVLRIEPGLPAEPDALAAARLDCALPMAQVLHGAPARLEIGRDSCPGLGALSDILTAEARAGRCGSPHVMARMFEAMLVLALRRVIDAAPPERGLLAGLSHRRLHRALVAIHGDPDKPWTIETLAAEAGMSRSRFMAAFATILGTSPMAYVARWRMGQARGALFRGTPLRDVVRQTGYGSPAAFRRAWRRQFGDEPLSRDRGTDPHP